MNHSLLSGIKCLAILLLICITLNADAQTIAAEEPVSYDVSSTGAFTYSLPIRIPPGIKELMPSLSVVYNSQNNSNGSLGIGWQLSGLSSITRGGTTLYHNSMLDPVDFDGSDNFYIDGQLMYPVGGGATYENYKTWINNFSQITCSISTSGIHDYFIVEYPNGVVYEYGNSLSSKMLGQGKTSVLMWAVNKIYDKDGNYIEFEYNNNQSTGEYRVSKIKYTGNSSASLLPPSEIIFSYNTKNEQNRTWFAGSMVQDNVVLDNIEVKHNGASVNKYQFTYNPDFFLHLTKITETRAGTSLPDVNIYWGAAPTTEEVHSTNYWGSGWSTYALGDFNADGATDYVNTPYGPTGVATFDFYSNNKNNTFTKSGPYISGYTSGNIIPMVFSQSSKLTMDFNGDGYDDLFLIRTHDNGAGDYADFTIYYQQYDRVNGFSNGMVPIFFYYNDEPGNAPVYTSQIRLLAGDFDGDGKKDILVFTPSALLSSYGRTYDIFMVTENGNTSPPVLSGSNGHVNGFCEYVGQIQHGIYESVAGDFDGDGKTDFIITNDNSSLSMLDCEMFTLNPTYTGTGNAIVASAPGSPTSIMTKMMESNYPSYNHTKIHVGDFNGDGKDDLFTFVPIYMAGPGTPGPGIWDIAYSTGDFNGGYSPNAFAFGAGTTTTTTSPGHHTSLPPNMNAVIDGTELSNVVHQSVHVADFNGDGKDDICKLYKPLGSTIRDVTYHMFYSKGFNNYEYRTGTLNNFDPFWASLAIGDFNGDGQADFLCHNQGDPTYQASIANFSTNDTRGVVTSIEHAGKTVTVGTIPLAQKADYVYSPIICIPCGMDPTWPHYSKQYPIKVVESMSDGVSLNNRYQYNTLVAHHLGFGFRGFMEVFVKNLTGSKLTRSVYKNYRDYKVPFASKVEYWDLTTYYDYKNGLKPYSPLIESAYGQTDDATSYYGGIVRNVVPGGSSVINHIDGTETYVSVSYTPGTHPYNDYGVFDKVTTTKGPVTEEIAYTYNSAAMPFHLASKVINATTTTSRVGKPPYVRGAEFQYDALGHVSVSKADPATTNEKVTSYNYDGFGNVIQTTLTAATGVTGSIVDLADYSGDGRFKVKTTNALNYETTATHNDWGAVLTSTNINGQTTTNEYDALNRLKKSTDHLGISKSIVYDWASALTDNPGGNSMFAVSTTTSGLSGSSISFTNIYGKQLRTVSYNFNGVKIYKDNVYLTNGLLDYSTLPYNSSIPSSAIKTTLTYDEADRPTQTVNSANGETIRTTYTETVAGGVTVAGMEVLADNLSTGHKKLYFNDASGQQYKLDDNGNIIEYELNSIGKPDKQTINTSIVTTYDYDAFGNLKEIIEPNAGTTHYDYNALGLMTQKNENGKISNYSYDKLDRLTQTTESGIAGSYTITYGNTPNVNTTGKVLTSTSPHGTNYTYSYNALGQIDRFDQTIGFTAYTTKYTYDGYQRKLTQQYPSGDVIRNNYNAYGYHESIDLVSTLTGATPQKLWRMDIQNAMGLPTRTTYFTNTSMPSPALYRFNRTYDALGMPIGRRVLNLSAGAAVVDFNYDIDNISGNMKYREDLTRSLREDFTYDADFDRLLTSSNNVPGSSVLTMEYSNIGNITHKSDVSDPLTATPSVPKFDWIYNKYALTKVQSPQTSTPAYAIPVATQQVWYYPFNKVQKVLENGKSAEFVYWPDEQRASMEEKTYTGILVKGKYYAAQYEKTVDVATGNIEELSYVFGAGEPVAILRHKNVGASSSFDVLYPITDHLGSITHVLDNQGVVNNGLVEERSYDAWGRFRDPATWQPYTTVPTYMFDRGYTGHEHLTPFNIINMNGRLYDPLVGRMFSPDPYIGDFSNSQDYNKYTYVRNNPLKYTDPSGNFLVGLFTTFINNFTVGIFKTGNLNYSWDKAVKSVKNSVDISNGLTKGTFGQFLSRLTWESPQTGLGYGYHQFMNTHGNIKEVSYYDGATVSETESTAFGATWGGTTLGSFILGDETINNSPTNELFQHEYGHYLQSQKSGPKYLTKYAVSSAVSGINNDANGHNHSWMEMDANYRAYHHFLGKGKITTDEWDEFGNPIGAENNPRWFEYLLP